MRPRHFSLTPTDSDGNRTFQPEIQVSGYGDLTYIFTAEVVTCAEAYRQMAAKKFKGPYRLESKEEQEQRNQYYNGSEEIEAPCGRGPDEVPQDWGGVYAARCPDFRALRALTGMVGPARLARAARHGSARPPSFMPLNDLGPTRAPSSGEPRRHGSAVAEPPLQSQPYVLRPEDQSVLRAS